MAFKKDRKILSVVEAFALVNVSRKLFVFMRWVSKISKYVSEIPNHPTKFIRKLFR